MGATNITQSMTWLKRLVLVVLGLLLSLAQAPFDITFIYFVILPFIGWCVRDVDRPVLGFGIGWWFGFGYFALTMHWIIEPFLVEPNITGWMAPFALSFMAAGLALFWGISFAAAVKIMPTGAGRVVVLAISWTIFEYLRANILTGFPWGHLSYGLLSLPIAQMAAWFGIHGTGLVLLLICFLPAIFAPRVWDGALWAVILLLAIGAVGAWRSSNSVAVNDQNTMVRVVQPNAAQHLKWRRDMVDVFYARQLGYTMAKTPIRPDIVIWPETAIPQLLEDNLPLLQEIGTASGPKTAVIAGIVRRQGNTPRNSMVFLDPVGGVNTVYDKQHLVPFGEYMPFADLIDRLGLSGLTGLVGRFQAGVGPRVITGHNVPDFIPLICYEAIFPQYVRQKNGDAEWIVHITNDAWFGNFSGPYQHLAQARMRAIETGLPVVRSANTGVSAMINPYGQVIRLLELGTAGYFDHRLPAAISPTLYARTGEWVWMIIAALLLIITFLRALRVYGEID
jgi:apolipoprotein N-acyltransferase